MIKPERFSDAQYRLSEFYDEVWVECPACSALVPLFMASESPGTCSEPPPPPGLVPALPLPHQK